MRFRSAILVLAVLSLLILAPFSSDAQSISYSISGTVKSMTTGQGVPYAAVDVRDAATNAYVISAYCDATGKYTVAVPGAGEYTLAAMETGFEQKSSPARVTLSEESQARTGVDVLMDSVINFFEGWNFISFPREPADPTLETALAPIVDKIKVIWAYGNNEWTYWQPGSLPKNLTEIRSGKGYWFYMTGPTYIDISAWYYPNDWLWLSPGWNLVGFAGQDGQTLPDALKTYDGQWSIMWTWDKEQWYAKDAVLPSVLSYPAFDKFLWGRAYWVKIKESGDSANWEQAPANVVQIKYQDTGISGATVSVYAMDGTLVYREQNATSNSGLLFAPTTELPSSFILEVTGGTQSGSALPDLRTIVNAASPRSSYQINEITTLIAAYMEKNPTKTYDEAVAAVKSYLSIPDYIDMKDVITSVGYSRAFFSPQKFAEARGTAGFKDFIDTLAGEVDSGAKRDFSDSALLDDLFALFDPDGWTVAGLEEGQGAARLRGSSGSKDPLTSRSFYMNETINFGLSILFAPFQIWSMVEEGEQTAWAMETLARIDENVQALHTKIDNLQQDMANRFGQLGLQIVWGRAYDKLDPYEKAIVGAFSAYKGYTAAKKRLAKAQQDVEDFRQDPAGFRARKGNEEFVNVPDANVQDTLAKRVTEESEFMVNNREEFFTKMRKPNGKSHFVELLQDYQSYVIKPTDEAGTAIELFAAHLKGNMSGSDNTAYTMLKHQFLKMILLQLAAVRMIDEFKATIATCNEQCGKDEMSAYFMDDKDKKDARKMYVTQLAITGEGQTNAGTTADPNFGKQVLGFERAVELLVVSHYDPGWYTKWMSCDNSMSYHKPFPIDCRATIKDRDGNDRVVDFEKPFMESTMIADLIIGWLKKLKDKEGKAYCSDSSYDHYTGSGGLYLKLVKFYDDKAPTLVNHAIVLADESAAAEIRIPSTAGTIMKSRNMGGKNPYGPNGAATGNWSVATYHLDAGNYKTTRRFINPTHEGWGGLHPGIESVYYQDPAYAEYYPAGNPNAWRRIPLVPVQNRQPAEPWYKNLAKLDSIDAEMRQFIESRPSYGLFNAWIVMVADGYLGLAPHRGPGYNEWRNPTVPVFVGECSSDACELFVNASYSSREGTGQGDNATLFRFFRLGPGMDDFAIGYTWDRKRHFVLPCDPAQSYFLYGRLIVPSTRWRGFPNTWAWQFGRGNFDDNSVAPKDYLRLSLANQFWRSYFNFDDPWQARNRNVMTWNGWLEERGESVTTFRQRWPNGAGPQWR